jgi:hypothetical protein
LNAFTDTDLAPLTRESGRAVGLLWFVLFVLADGRTGVVRGASMNRLERITGMNRTTVRLALRVLANEELITITPSGQVPAYKVKHFPAARG